MGSSEKVVRAVVERVADREETDPIALDPPLHAVVDTDALAALFPGTRDPDSGVVVQFTYHGYRITIEGQESITIHEVSEPAV